MTASITLTPDTLIIDIEGTDKLWALKSRLQVPFANVAAVAPAESKAREWLHGIRLGGTHIPGVITAGRFYSHGKWVFWDVHDPAKAIGIELRNEHYSKLIVQVGNPEDQISQIRQATGQTLGRRRMASGGSSQAARPGRLVTVGSRGLRIYEEGPATNGSHSPVVPGTRAPHRPARRLDSDPRARKTLSGRRTPHAERRT